MSAYSNNANCSKSVTSLLNTQHPNIDYNASRVEEHNPAYVANSNITAHTHQHQFQQQQQTQRVKNQIIKMQNSANAPKW